jgi:hypothetical protein
MTIAMLLANTATAAEKQFGFFSKNPLTLAGAPDTTFPHTE